MIWRVVSAGVAVLAVRVIVWEGGDDWLDAWDYHQCADSLFRVVASPFDAFVTTRNPSSPSQAANAAQTQQVATQRLCHGHGIACTCFGGGWQPA